MLTQRLRQMEQTVEAAERLALDRRVDFFGDRLQQWTTLWGKLPCARKSASNSS